MESGFEIGAAALVDKPKPVAGDSCPESASRSKILQVGMLSLVTADTASTVLERGRDLLHNPADRLPQTLAESGRAAAEAVIVSLHREELISF